MSAKYNISDRERWRLKVDSRPRLSDHVVGGGAEDGSGRWDERTPPKSVSPETAWERGVDLDDHLLPWFRGATQGGPPQQVRLFAENADGVVYAVVLPIPESGDRVVTTVLRVATIWDAPKRAFLYAKACQEFDLGVDIDD